MDKPHLFEYLIRTIFNQTIGQTTMKKLHYVMVGLLVPASLLGGCASNGTGNTFMGKPVHWGVFERDMNHVVDMTGGRPGTPAYIRVNYKDKDHTVEASITKVGGNDLMSQGLVNSETFNQEKDGYAVTVVPGKTTLYIRCRPGFHVGSSRESAWGEPTPVEADLQPGFLYYAAADEIQGDYCHPILGSREFNYTPPAK